MLVPFPRFAAKLQTSKLFSGLVNDRRVGWFLPLLIGELRNFHSRSVPARLPIFVALNDMQN